MDTSCTFFAALAVLAAVSTTGCTGLETLYGIEAIPATRLPEEFRMPSREAMIETSMARLRQTPPEVYQLGPDDILGVYIETILGAAEEPPPVHFPEEGERAPSIGYPIPVREDGTIALPLIPALKVSGLTLAQATERIRQAYTVDQRLLPEGKDRIIVTLLKRRTYRVNVIREEAGGVEGVLKQGTGYTIDLPAYENDLLHALTATGGMPGLDAKNEVCIIRGPPEDAVKFEHYINQVLACQDPCSCPPELPTPPNVIRIALRYYPGEIPQFDEEDIILQTGDIVLIESRSREKFYTGGVLGGGEYLLPRDYDLDILQAVAVAGGTVGNTGAVVSQAGGRGGAGSRGRGRFGGGALPPSQAIVVRELCDGTSLPIRVNLDRALTDAGQRLIVAPEDVIIVRYTCTEEIVNTLLGLVQFNFLFNGLNGGGF